MIPNNNLSVLPWYTSIEQQNARKWWVYNRVYPLYCQAGYILPFQCMRQSARGNKIEMTPGVGGYDIVQDVGMCIHGGSTVELQETLGVNASVAMYEVTPGETIIVDAIAFPYLPAEEPYQPANYAFTANPLGSGATYGRAYAGDELIVPPGCYCLTVQRTNDTFETGTTTRLYRLDNELKRITEFSVFTREGNLVGEFTEQLYETGLCIKQYDDIDVIVYPGLLPMFESFNIGQYYVRMSDDVNTWYSEVFTVVKDMEPYIKIEWWDTTDLHMDAGVISYTDPEFKNRLYLPSDIAKPTYSFEEEGSERDGYFFPEKQISKKTYRFAFLASEYLLDVMRLIRLSDFVRITKAGQEYSVDTFLLTPEWTEEGSVAEAIIEFTTATVVKKIGVGYIKAQRGDFNDDFNKDFNN